MTNEFVTVEAGLTAGEALAALRDALREPDFVYFIYAVAAKNDRRLAGVVSLRDLVVADADRPLSDLMTRDVEVIRVGERADRAAWRVVETQLAALPVVDEAGLIVGVLTVDAAVAAIAPPVWRAQAPRLFA